MKEQYNQRTTFRDTYERYAPQLYRYINATVKNSEDTEELVQNIFVKIWEMGDELNRVVSLEAYLFTVARNMMFNHLKSKYYTCVLQHSDMEGLQLEEPSCELSFIAGDLIDHLNILLNKLPERRREIFILNRFYGYTYREIAEKLSISENTVDTQIRRVLQYLRENVDDKLLLLLPILFI